MFLINVVTSFLVIVAIFTVGGDSFMCDTCTCQNSIVNCTETGLSDILDLWDHSEALNNATIVHFNDNNIIMVKKLPPSKLKYLSLRHNKISKIENMAFANLMYLMELDLSYNFLSSDNLNSEIFKVNSVDSSNPRNLINLHLDYNNIHTLSPYVFKELGNLAVLSLAGNNLKYIDRQTSLALTSLPMLKVLNLSNTSLSQLPEHLLHTPRYLDSINLSKNKFTEIPQGLSEAHSLHRLDFSYNPVKSILDFPKVLTLKVLHLSHMPELKTIGPHALKLLSNLEHFYCTHNNKLKSIDPAAFIYLDNRSDGEIWPPLKRLDLSYNALRYLDSRLLSRWDTLDYLNLQGNSWVCDCENQWFVSTLAPMAESRHPAFLTDFTCQEPIEMSGFSILELDHRHYHMRCLDFYNNRPERDGILLVGILIGVILAVPFTMGIMMCCAKRKNSLSYYHRIFNQYKNPHQHDYQLRETSVYQPTSIITDGY